MKILPFSAFVGLDELKKALLALAVDPSIGGLLIMGPKGTGKSSIVRAFAELLPEIEVVADCPFNCDPHDVRSMCDLCRSRVERGEKLPVKRVKMRVITLPIGATEDMVLGTINIERTLKEGRLVFEPGLLGRANRNILYIDEVNLLPDHLVDSILDAAASGWNIVEREGISLRHPSRFILVGTMNPEEGELRPQLLDRFSIGVKLKTIRDPELRAKIIRVNLEYERSPREFEEKWRPSQEALKARIERARRALPDVKISDELIARIARTCSLLEVDGYRPDIVAAKVAIALAALDGLREVTEAHVIEALKLALAHRTRAEGLKPPPSEEEIAAAFRGAKRGAPVPTVPKKGEKSKYRFFLIKNIKLEPGRVTIPPWLSSLALAISLLLILYLALVDVRLAALTLMLWLLLDMLASRGGLYRGSRALLKTRRAVLASFSLEKSGKLGLTLSKGIRLLEKAGEVEPSKLVELAIDVARRRARVRGRRRIRAKAKPIDINIPRCKYFKIAIVPTLRRAAVARHFPGITWEDVRTYLYEGRGRASLIVVLDSSASMAYSLGGIITALKALERRARRSRDRVSVVVCKGFGAAIAQHPTTNFNLVISKLRSVGLDDFTPLASGMYRGLLLALEERRRGYEPVLVIVSDGNANVPLERALPRHASSDPAVQSVVEVAKMIAKAEIETVIINTKHRELEHVKRYDFMSGTQVLLSVARITRGTYVGLVS